MNVEKYLESTLSQYPLDRIKIRADIELQRLVDDKIIYFGDAYYLRDDTTGFRNGVVCEWKMNINSVANKVEIRCQQV